jgi:hypothetical protein
MQTYKMRPVPSAAWQPGGHADVLKYLTESTYDAWYWLIDWAL